MTFTDPLPKNRFPSQDIVYGDLNVQFSPCTKVQDYRVMVVDITWLHPTDVCPCCNQSEIIYADVITLILN